MTEFNKMQTLKRRFFAMRNGVIADALRRGGSKFRVIFGLNLPQIVEIAAEMGHDPELAMQLWANNTTRESMLIAPMLLSPEDLTPAQLDDMIADIADTEIADNFCHRLLRRYPDAIEIALRLAQSPQPMDRYIAIRLMLNIFRSHPDLAASLAKAEIARNEPLTSRISRQLLDRLEPIDE